MLIGWVLLVSLCAFDSCDAMPVTGKTYSTQAECQKYLEDLHKRRPDVVLICGEVYRDE